MLVGFVNLAVPVMLALSPGLTASGSSTDDANSAAAFDRNPAERTETDLQP